MPLSEPAAPVRGREPSAGTLRVSSPATGETVGVVSIHDDGDVYAAVERARRTSLDWGSQSPRERCSHLKRVRSAWAAAVGDLARTVSAETGKPRPDATMEIVAGVPMLSYVIREAPRALRSEPVGTGLMTPIKRAWIERSPYGVVGVITPWNYPVGITMQSLPWVLACGNTMVLKPSELTPLTGLLIGEIVNSAGLPLIEVATGGGPTGAALVRSGVGKIVFTGSGPTGRRIMADAAEAMTPVIMELGGKDPMIVCDDADLDAAARTAVAGAFSNAGQTCMAVERVFVTSGIWDGVVERILAEADRLRVGTDDSSHVGPLTDPRRLEIIERRLADAVAGGARILRGGHRIESARGAWLEPTVVSDVPPGCELVREETFGPVMIIEAVADEDEAVRRANGSHLGLSASVFTRSPERARRLAGRLEAGGVVVNDAIVGAGIPALPFGGEKGSGIGRLQGRAGFDAFSRTRSVVAPRFGTAPGLLARMCTGRRPPAQLVERSVRLAYRARTRKDDR